MIEFIESNRGDGKPFFGYVSHIRRHTIRTTCRRLAATLQHREYDQGWDVTRKQRLQRMIELGIIPEGTQLAERMWFLPEASNLAPGPRAMAGARWSSMPRWWRTWTTTSAAS